MTLEEMREMMTERKPEELEEGKYYWTRSKHRREDGTPFDWFIGIKVNDRIVMIKVDDRIVMALCVSAYYINECETFLGPVPMPEVTQ